MARDMVAKTGGDRNTTLQSIGAPMVGFMQQIGVKDPQRAQVLVQEVVMPIVTEHYEGLVDLQARAYAQTLSIPDMQATLAFYDTPAGRDLIAAGPKLAQARVTSITQWMSGLQPEMMAKMQSVIKAHGWDKPDQ